MIVRDDQTGSCDPSPLGDDSGGPGGRRAYRLNLLLSYGGWRQENAIDQLPRLLTPMGISAIRVNSGEEAADIIQTTPIHIAVVDLAIPLHRRDESTGSQPFTPGGSRILQLLRRLPTPPPTVVVRPPQSAARESTRTLSQALREGAFAVLDRPINLETMLETMRRILRRCYADNWPASGSTNGNGNTPRMA
jgi:CheY-like chemotaxis protein